MKKFVVIIRKDVRVCEIDKDKVSVRKRRREKIRVFDITCLG